MPTVKRKNVKRSVAPKKRAKKMNLQPAAPFIGEEKAKPLWVRILRSIRGNFLTGLVVSMPLVITFYLANWFIDFVDNQIIPLLSRFASVETGAWLSGIPGLGLVVAVISLILLGWLAANVLGQTLIKFGERIVDRLPLIRTIYHALKQIFETIISNRTGNFEEVCLIEYPRPGVFALAFITTTIKGEIKNLVKAKRNEDSIAVFLPTTPNPTSGFVLFLPRGNVQLLEMSVENGIKMVISGGLLEPKNFKN